MKTPSTDGASATSTCSNCAAFKFCEDRLVRLMLADHHRNVALEEIAHHGGADEPRAPCYEEFHHASPSLATA